MLTKKVYLPIGALIIAIVAIGMFALRSEQPTEPITIYNTVTPIKRSGTPTTEARTVSASMPIEETVEETPVSTSEVSEVPMSYILSEFPDYESMNSVSQEVARRRAKLRWEGKNRRAKKAQIIQAREAEIAALREEVRELKAVGDELEEVVSYMVPLGERMSEYPDVISFIKKYPNAQPEDFLREYPESGERLVFLKRLLAYDDLRVEMAGHVLGSPAMKAELPPDTLEYLAMPSIRDSINNPKWRTYIESGGARFE